MKTSEIAKMIAKKHVTEAVLDPKKIFEEAWYLDPAFCRGFFDRCEDLALTIQPEAFELSRVAVEMACRHAREGGTGGTCIEYRSHGVLSHAYVARAEPFWAGHTLDFYRPRALDCCHRCRSEFLLREGDLLGEERDAAGSLEALNASLEEGGKDLADDARGRILFPRSIAFHHAGQRRRAIDDAGEALRCLDLESPRGFFLDSLALLAIFVGGGDPRDDARALEHIRSFEQRIRGGRGWTETHTRRLWSEAHLHAGLDDITKAYRRLTRAWGRLLHDGLDREFTAVTLDRAQIKCRPTHLRDDNLETAKEAIDKSLRQRPNLKACFQDLLKEALKVLKYRPEEAFVEIDGLRKSFIAPVPSRLAERLLSQDGDSGDTRRR